MLEQVRDCKTHAFVVLHHHAFRYYVVRAYLRLCEDAEVKFQGNRVVHSDGRIVRFVAAQDVDQWFPGARDWAVFIDHAVHEITPQHYFKVLDYRHAYAR